MDATYNIVTILHLDEDKTRLEKLTEKLIDARLPIIICANDDLTNTLASISHSYVVVMFLTNKYLKLEEFKQAWNTIITSKKIVLIVLLEKIDESIIESNLINIYEFNVIEMYEIDGKSLIKNDQIQHFYMYFKRLFAGELIYDTHGRQKSSNREEFKNENPISKPVIKKTIKFSNEITNLNDLKLIKIEEKKMILIFCLNSFNTNEYGDCLGEWIILLSNEIPKLQSILQSYECNISSITWIDHLKVFVAYSLAKQLFILFDGEYNFVQENKIISINDSNLTVNYCSLNKKTFIFQHKNRTVIILDEKLNEEKLINLDFEQDHQLKFNLCNDKIYITEFKNRLKFKSIKINLYDLNLNYVTTFYHYDYDEDDRGLFDIISITDNSNYIIVAKNYKLDVFNMISCKSVGLIELDRFGRVSVFGDKLIVINKSMQYMYDFKYLNLNNDEARVDSKYVCQLNSDSEYHTYIYPFLIKPYILPCDNTACLKCIYENYNIFTKKLKCNFDTCKSEHLITKKDIKLNDHLIKDMIDEALCKKYNKSLKEALDKLSEYINKTNIF